MLKIFFILFLYVQIFLHFSEFEILSFVLGNPTEAVLIFAMIAYNIEHLEIPLKILITESGFKYRKNMACNMGLKKLL
jgi:4-hydroxy-3-methylbut-2-en-1-yl diphosphate synthase IspG/GcpE